jgi:hypothetical protein
MTKKKKHATKMTTEEAVKHLFHPHVVKHAKKTIEERNVPKELKRDKRD